MNTPNTTERELPPDSVQLIELELQHIRSDHIAALLKMQAKLSEQIGAADTDAKRIRLRDQFDSVSAEIQQNIDWNKSSNAAVKTAQFMDKLC